jgi:fatty aldehyde decarbonylase
LIPIACLPAQQAPVWRDVLAQAVTGELIGALNYETLAGMFDEAEERAEAREHAAGERGHADRFRAVGRELGFQVTDNLEAPYWKRIRSAFLERARVGDIISCIIAQEVMLESFAVASYQIVGEAAPGKLGATFRSISGEEAEHIAHAVGMLQAERAKDGNAFDASVHRMHEEVMTTLAEMVAREDHAGHCGLCETECVKPRLASVCVNLSEIRGASLQRYLKTLDQIGVPGQLSLGWVARLPV